jgi:hypothetical protein
VAVLSLHDNVAEVDAYAHVDALPVGHAVVAFGHAALEDNRAFDGIDYAGELGQDAVAHQLEDAAVVLLDFRLENSLRCARSRSNVAVSSVSTRRL